MLDTTAKAPIEKVVALILPELLSGLADIEALRTTFGHSPASSRALICIPDAADPAIVAAVINLGVDTQILLGPDVEAPATSAFILRAPPGSTSSDQKEFALALSDVVLAPVIAKQDKLLRLAEDLGKPVVPAGAPVPAVPPITAATHQLDPEFPRYRWTPSVAGRLEQGIMELLAYNWRGGEDGVAESRKRLRRCVTPGWRPRPYFAPDSWEELSPDTSIDAKSKIALCFDELDRSALYGSYIHRDFTWLEHLLAALAVFVAVAGHVFHVALAAGASELIVLSCIAFLVFRARRTHLQDRWTACRLGAEQLRIARMSLPLLVLPSALATADKPPSIGGHNGKQPDYGFMALAQVKRAIRDHGLPRLAADFSPPKAAAWVRLIVGDQITYHHDNNLKLEQAERRLRISTQVIFAIAVAAVVGHFIFREAEWLLLFTAAFPALAAALHGTGTRLGIVHRAALSGDVERQLGAIDTDLAGFLKTAAAAEASTAWREARHLTFEAAKAMGQENTSWHGLVRRYRDDLP